MSCRPGSASERPGREGSKYGIEEYMDTKYLCMATGQ